MKYSKQDNLANIFDKIDRRIKALERISVAESEITLTTGTAIINIPGTETATSSTIPHNLSDVPVAVVATADHSLGLGSSKMLCSVGNIDDTDFNITIRTVDGSTPSGNVTVYWIASL